MRNRRVLAATIAASLVLGPASAYAQAEGAGADKAASPSKVDEARSHYERGLKLYEDGAYDGARTEFERAYELAPSYRILYNIGLVYQQQQDFVGALRYLQSYLDEGGQEVPEVRRKEVTRLISELQPRIGTLTVTTNVAGAEISIDDAPLGKTPLSKPARVNPGRRRVMAQKKGYLPTTKLIEMTGSDSRTIHLELSESRTLVVVEKQRRVPWVGWGITGALAVVAGITGYAALTTSSSLEKDRAQQGANPDELESKADSVRLYSIVSDVAGAGAIIVGGVSLYLTIKWGRDVDQSDTKATAHLGPARPVGFAFSGRF